VTKPIPPAHFSPDRQRFFERACTHVSANEVRRMVADVVGIPSYVGHEAPLARYFTERFEADGVAATFQAFAPDRANALGRRSGDGTGPDLLLYAPIDMHVGGDDGDGPGLELDGRPDLLPRAVIDGDYVIGLGAENPKGHAVSVAAAVIALARAGIPLHGDVIAGLGAGGMPVSGTAAHPAAGHGIGCAYMLEHGTRPDFAAIAKPGGAVAYEEVGLCWFELTVHGAYSYAGIPQRKRNAVVDAATVIARLTAWFPEYTARHTSGLVAPLGTVTAIAGGWPEKPAFLPDVCAFYIDLRLSPRTTPAEAARELEAALDAIRADVPGLTVTSKLLIAIPGTSTPPDNWIVTSSIAAWEAIYQKPHVLRTGTSGATDADILRGYGIPTARIGTAALGPDAPFAGRFSMGVVSVDALVQLTTALIAIAIDTCTRTRAEAGLANRKEVSPA
jgi:acetylornithine deacetylase/succinyl-diaminopimelate desuccinylase-like protein